MSSAAPPPITPADVTELLRRIGELSQHVVLVGGQALAFWREHYGARISVTDPINSKDIDFGGERDVVAQIGRRLGATWNLAELFGNSASVGVVDFTDLHGQTRRIDFLDYVYGIELPEVFAMAVEVEVPTDSEPVAFRVMHPVHCLESRISNVGGLPGYDSKLGLDQARVAVQCAKEHLRDRLADGAIRAVLDLGERIYRFAWENQHARTVVVKFGIDPFAALIADDDRLPEAFRTKRYPQMVAGLKRRRRSWRLTE